MHHSRTDKEFYKLKIAVLYLHNYGYTIPILQMKGKHLNIVLRFPKFKTSAFYGQLSQHIAIFKCPHCPELKRIQDFKNSST